jgi:hypothetical protein
MMTVDERVAEDGEAVITVEQGVPVVYGKGDEMRNGVQISFNGG